MTKVKGVYDIKELTNAIVDSLSDYNRRLIKETRKLSHKIAKEGAYRLTVVSPEDTGSYRKGWRVKQVDGRYVVHNATDYQLTHLLEHGHAKVGGGRIAPRPHIKPVEESMIKDFVEEMEVLIKK
ncbi:HK97 gp10 family phage protein [Kurthia gibsonii]|uniref:HK97 gp10 family phage protein n=1 Tax=Kurthia gibsonii TaxID=33946 RepID=UPI003F1F7E0E